LAAVLDAVVGIMDFGTADEEVVGLAIPIEAEFVIFVPLEHHARLVFEVAPAVGAAYRVFKSLDWGDGTDFCFKLLDYGNLCHVGISFGCALPMLRAENKKLFDP
jgi:hypothetical protein